ncbi:M30 family zinc metallopeptidase [Cupriavidus agavae]|uniref:Peptidase M30-like protein n=1 Tax=Cupriavidus agavae TaxID=1001822 RepID=A0A4Q7S9D7_9BURK|nr:hemagglutinin [Cupriavidus agavae]RZT42983.1 peptidase M30-like protein [Cupriavidus agavae]
MRFLPLRPLRHPVPPGLRFVAAAAALALAACGGGGGDDGAAATTAQAAAAPAEAPAGPLLVTGLSQTCSGCGAATSSTYAGGGVGTWGYPNTTGGDVDVQYAITGVAGKTIALQLANLGANGVALPTLSASVMAERLSPQSLSVESDEEATQRAIREFNRKGWVDGTQAASGAMKSTLAAPAPLAASLGTAGMTEGASRSWYHTDGTLRPATLRRQVTTGDGTRVNIWVETAESAAVTNNMVLELANTFAGPGLLYDRLVNVGGAVWGANAFNGTLLPAGMPIDIVVLNFNHDNKPYGTVGYFWGVHNFLKAREARSNEAVSLYLDSETLSLGATGGMQSIKTTMAHEGTHMQNFYRRQVSMGSEFAYDAWLEEMTAMQMEDFLSGAIVSGYNPIGDVRLPDYYRYSDYNCNLLDFTGFGATCESYAVSGSFGGFLNRQLGVAFFRDLLTRRTANSKQVLGEAISAARPGWTFDTAFVNWRATTNSSMPAARTPDEYGYPAWTDGTFTLPALDPSASKYTTLRKLPATAPAALLSLGSYIAPRSDSNGVYSDKVRVPAGVTLSVVVY